MHSILLNKQDVFQSVDTSAFFQAHDEESEPVNFSSGNDVFKTEMDVICDTVRHSVNVLPM